MTLYHHSLKDDSLKRSSPTDESYPVNISFERTEPETTTDTDTRPSTKKRTHTKSKVEWVVKNIQNSVRNSVIC